MGMVVGQRALGRRSCRGGEGIQAGGILIDFEFLFDSGVGERGYGSSQFRTVLWWDMRSTGVV